MKEVTSKNAWISAWRRVNRAIPKLLLLPICFAGALTLVAIGFSEYHHASALAGVDQLRNDRDHIDEVESIYSLLVAAENGQRGYLLTGKSEFLVPLERAGEALSQLQNRLAVSFANRPVAMRNADALRELANRKLVELQTTLELYRLGETQKALDVFNSGRGTKTMDDLRARVTAFSELLNGEFTASRQRWEQQMITARIGMLSLALLNLLLLVTVVVLLTRRSEQHEYISRLIDGENVRLVREVEARTAELNDLTNHLQFATEKDKAALARDLHDELGGVLTSAKMDLDWLKSHVRDGADVNHRLAQLAQLLDEAVQVKRRVIEDLRPSLLDNLGLVAALEWYLGEHCKRAGVEHTLEVVGELDGASPDEAIAIYRVVQEALTNVIRHAGAAHFDVRMELAGGHLIVEMMDDGKGFSASFNPSKFSHGIAGMRQRSHALGGNITWTSSPGEGTTVRLTIPREAAAT